MKALILASAVALVAATSPATSPEAAVKVVEDYYAALDGAASGQTFAQFRAGFLQTASVRVVTQPATNADAGMSQRTIDVPVDVYATLKNGGQQHFRGTYTLRRVVEGVGAPASQLSWHLSSATLVQVAH